MGPMPYPTTKRVSESVETTVDTWKYSANAGILGATMELPI